MKKLSVIIPVYNGEKYIERCLDSVLSQTFDDFEILCINDFSTDNSLEILKEYEQTDERIRIINNPENLGLALSRNVGIDNAKGEYIYFIDIDDYIDKDYLEVMVQKSEQTNSDIILNLSILTDTNGNETFYKHPSMPHINDEGEHLDKITTIHDAPCFIWARIYRKSFFDKYNLKFLNIYATEDVVFNTISNLKTENTFAFWGPKYHYTINNSSIVGTVTSDDVRDKQHIMAYGLIYDYLKEHNLFDDRLKLFRVYPFMRVNTSEKFDCYKEFFEKIKDDFFKCENIYNDLEKYFAYSVLNSQSYEDYLKNYSPVVTIGFLRRKK